MPERLTMKALADELGVSVTTVSNAYSKPDRISKELRERVLAGGRKLGYAGPSAMGRALRSGRSDVCGFLFGAEVAVALSDPYAILFLAGLSEVVEELGASVLLLKDPAGPDGESRLLQRAAMDALVITAPRTEHAGLEQLAQRGVRIVGTQLSDGEEWVGIDDVAAGRLVGDLLSRLGHRDITVVVPGRKDKAVRRLDLSGDTDDPWLLPGSFTYGRLRGLRDALPSARIRVVRVGQRGREGGRRAGASALDVRDRPTAVVAVSDVLAIGVHDAARDRGLVLGRDVSIVGFDDIPEAGFCGITTVRQPIAEKGRLAGRIAMDPDYPERQVTLPVQLVVRSSTGPAPLAEA